MIHCAKKMEENITDCWHIFTDGTKTDIPFSTDKEKKLAWNSIAICAHDSGVSVLVITVNDTHLHSMIRGTMGKASHFRSSLEHRLRFMNCDKTIIVDIQPITTRTEALSKFMYVYRNCMDFYHKLPGTYPWGSGNIYFAEIEGRGMALSTLSLRGQFRSVGTKKKLPQEWRIDVTGRILPESFIDKRYVEHLFVSVRAFIAFQYVRKEDEARMKLEIHQSYYEQRRIQELRIIGNRYSKNYCGHVLRGAPIDIRLKVAHRMLNERISGKSASLAKALFLKPDDLRWLL